MIIVTLLYFNIAVDFERRQRAQGGKGGNLRGGRTQRDGGVKGEE